ncbi:MAG: Gfo/Idh/MocA family oxidoreductase [Victivallales bacterium]|jgi:predicted dehydrogenase|nr:Gfo/Idh/MocA family oxidoreductase [Victivallales bacterium]
MKKLTIGLIGVGGRGQNGWLSHKPEDGVRIIAGADPDPKAFAKFKEKFPNEKIAEYSDYQELLKNPEVDAVFISSPDFCHEEQAVAALYAGKHVYLEKPMAITIAGCDRILKAAMESKSKLFIGHNMRHFPVILKMKEIIDSGAIGEIRSGWCRHFIGYGGDAYFHDWHSEQRYSNGLLLQKGAHDIDVMHWLMGGYTKSVVGMGMLSVYDKCARRPPNTIGSGDYSGWSDEHYPPLEQTGFSPIIDVEDHNMILMQLDNGTQACYTQSHYSPDSERNYTFIGTRGRIENIGDNGQAEIHVWNRRGPRETPDIIYNIKPLAGTHGGSDVFIVQNFIDFIRCGRKTNTSPIAARNSVATGVKGHESMRGGCNRCDIPPLSPDVIEYFENGQIG